VLRDPKRLAPWLLVLAWVGFTRIVRFAPVSVRHAPVVIGYPNLLPIVAVFVPGAYLALLGISLARASIRAPATFRSPADARFLIGSAIPPRLVVGWLQLRRVIGLMVVSAFNLVIIVAFLPFGADSPSRLSPLFLAIVGAYVTLQAVPMLGYLGSRRVARLPVGRIGIALTVLGGASLLVALAGALDLAPPLPAWLQDGLLSLPPGEWIRDAYHGQALAPILMIALAAVAVAATIHLSGDCYPELWESSSRVFTLRRLARERGGPLRPSDVRRALGQQRGRRVASNSGARVPAGAAAILWKEWLALRRAPGALPTLLAFISGSAVVGGAVGVLFASRHGELAVPLTTVGATLTLMYSVYAGLRLGAELGNPVWWLSADGLRERLLAWTVASALRQAIPVCLGCSVALAILGDYGMMAAALVGVPIATWTLRAVALASYALVPAGSDLRGPGRLLRLLLYQICAIPPIAVMIAVAIVTNVLAAGVLTATVVVLGEGWVLLELATWLIRRNGLAYVHAEAR
jgi:hypothetical protein